jgi:hypothetical protein
MTVDVDALALGVPPSTDSAQVAAELQAMSPEDLQQSVDRARQTIQRRVRVRFDGEKQTPSVEFPEFGAEPARKSTVPTFLGTTARLRGEIPDGAREFTFGASRAFQAVHLTIVGQTPAVEIKHVLGVGEDSPPYALRSASAAPSFHIATALLYVRLGFEHILPRGLDHILFVLGLYLLNARLRPLLWQVTAFTVAHSATLALSTYGVIALPSRLVESLIALSIAYVAVENMLTSRLTAWRPVVVFCFGLLHGLGFAGVLRELGLPPNEFLMALVSFNVGVEMGQLSVVLLAFLAIGWLRDRSWYRSAVVLPASALIAGVGIYWSLQRAFGIF